MKMHPGTDRYNPAGNSDFTRKAEVLALGIHKWSTPKATDGAKGGPGQSYGSGGMPPLPAQAAQWQTPVADDQMDRLRGKINSRGEPKLSAQAIQWPTPAAQNWKGSTAASVMRADGKSRMDILHYRAEQGFTHPVSENTPDGRRSSPHAPISRPLWASMIASHGRVVSRRILKARARRRLNPLFVGWLMGWPIGHARGTLGNGPRGFTRTCGAHPLEPSGSSTCVARSRGCPLPRAPGSGGRRMGRKARGR